MLGRGTVSYTHLDVYKRQGNAVDQGRQLSSTPQCRRTSAVRRFRKRATRYSRFAAAIGAEILGVCETDEVVFVENLGMIVSYDLSLTVARRTNTHGAPSRSRPPRL